MSVNCDFVSQKSADSAKNSPLHDRYKQLREQFKNDPAQLQKAMTDLEQEEQKYQVRATLADVVANIDHV
jgi:hypothetical protein